MFQKLGNLTALLIFYFRACTFTVFHRYHQLHTRHGEDESLICILDFTYGDIILLGDVRQGLTLFYLVVCFGFRLCLLFFRFR